MRRSLVVCLVTIVLISSAAFGSSGWMTRPGTIGNALLLPDGSHVYLDAVEVCKIRAGENPAYFAIQECFSAADKVVVLTQPNPLLRLGQTVDVEGDLTTLSNGNRAIEDASVLGYLDRNGNLLLHGPLVKGLLEPTPWEWKTDLTLAPATTSRMASANSSPAPPGDPSPTSTVTIVPCETIAEAKQQSDDTAVELRCKPISSTGSTYFIMGQDGSVDQLKVYCGKAVTTNDRICRVLGTMQTEAGTSERVLTVDANGPGYDPQVFEGAIQTISPGTIAYAKTLPDDTEVTLGTEITGKIVTRVWTDSLYIEEDDRSSGIKVAKTAHGRGIDDRAYVEGVIETDDNHERYIDASTVSLAGSGHVDPLGMNNKQLGGGDFFFDGLTSGQQGVTGGAGLNNIGLLTRAWGKVTAVDSSNPPLWFKIDDGAAVTPKVAYSPGNLAVGNYVAVTGISSCEISGSDILRVVRPGPVADLTKVIGLTAPPVTDDGDTMAPSSPLHASWDSPDYGVSLYRYRITYKDSQDVEHELLAWQETTATQITRTDLSLSAGNEYFFYVEAKTALSDWSPEGSSDGIACKNVIFVSTSGNNTTGLSWAHAKTTVDGGLAAVSSGGEVWVAHGTYTVLATPKTFTLVSGAGLYGGFNGDESAREQRSPKDHETILDGNKLGSVVTIPANATSATIIDGFTIRNGIGTNVSGSYYGGGIYCPSGATGSPLISHNKIMWNYVDSYGGGIYIGGGSPTITYNTITGNDGTYYGGGIYLANATATIANNVISANGAMRGGGIHCSDGTTTTTTIVNNTIAINDGNRGGGIYCNNSVTITGNIIAYNCSGIYQTSTTQYPTINYNCLYNATADYTNVTLGTGNELEDPCFARVSYGDLHIQPTSPCRNSGSNGAVQSLPTDIDGRTRILDTTVDMGAYESEGTTYSIPDRVYRVIGSGGNDDNDGSDWDTSHAMATVQAAVNKAAVAGGSVWVKGGTYSAPITFAEHVSLRPFVYLYGGFTGSDNIRGNYTTLDGTNNGRVLAIRGGYGVNAVDKFAIIRGSITGDNGAGIFCSNSSPVIYHNTIQGNTASDVDYTGGYGGGIYCYYGSPLVQQNYVGGSLTGQKNTATRGGGVASWYSKGTMTANTLSYNTGVYGAAAYSTGSATFTNNFMHHNKAAYSGSGICREGAGSAIIANNTITYNTSISDSLWRGGGGIYISVSSLDAGSVILANNLVAFNRDGICVYNYRYSTHTYPVFTKNCVWENRYGGALNNYIQSDPNDVPIPANLYQNDIFTNPYLQSEWSYSILLNSSCRNTADASYAPSIDIDGQSRPMGSGYDVGADEYNE